MSLREFTGRLSLLWKRVIWTLWMTDLLSGPVFSMRYQMEWLHMRLIKSSLIWYVQSINTVACVTLHS